MRVDQILPTISYGDAVGNCTLGMQKILRDMGFQSDIYAENIDPKINDQAKYFSSFKVNDKRDIIIFHMSTGSNLSCEVAKIPLKKIMIYHNITPSNFFAGYSNSAEMLTNNGRTEVQMLKDHIDLALCDSECNYLELKEYGYSWCGVLPLLVDFQDYEKSPDPRIINTYSDGKTNILFVGRIAPNKKQEDIIKTFYYYKKYIDKDARLFLVGSYSGMESYYKVLTNLVTQLGLEDVYFTGHTPFNQILAYYKIANVFLCMSEHEGFCVPLLESMYLDVPIIAYNSTAIPFTLGKAGIMFNKKDYFVVAEMINLVVSDEFIRKKIIAGQKKRLAYFNNDRIKNQLKEYIKQVVTYKK